VSQGGGEEETTTSRTLCRREEKGGRKLSIAGAAEEKEGMDMIDIKARGKKEGRRNLSLSMLNGEGGKKGIRKKP